MPARSPPMKAWSAAAAVAGLAVAPGQLAAGSGQRQAGGRRALRRRGIPARAGEAVGEDLVEGAAGQPGRRRLLEMHEVGVVARRCRMQPALVEMPEMAVLPLEHETVGQPRSAQADRTLPALPAAVLDAAHLPILRLAVGMAAQPGRLQAAGRGHAKGGVQPAPSPARFDRGVVLGPVAVGPDQHVAPEPGCAPDRRGRVAVRSQRRCSASSSGPSSR